MLELPEEIKRSIQSLIESLPKGDPAQFYIRKNIFDLKELDLDVSTMSSESRKVSALDRLKVTKQWETLIPYLTGLRSIGTAHKVTQRFFEAICSLKQIEEIRIKWSAIADIECLRNLKEIRKLEIRGAPKIQSIEVIASLMKLQSLRIENFKSPLDLQPISSLDGIEELYFSGGIHKYLVLKSIKPINNLAKVRSVRLPGVRILDKDIRCLANNKEIEEIQFGENWPTADLKYLEENLPRLKKYSWKSRSKD